MSISFIYPLALWLLILVPLTAALALAGPRRPTPLRFWFGLGLRLILLSAVVLALAGIQLRLRSNLLTVVFVLDVSDSIPAEQRAQGEAFIRQALEAMPRGDRAAIVLFGEDALVERLAGEESQLPIFASVPVSLRTNIQSAMQLALALFPDEGARRLVLFSDGRENLGSALSQAEFAAAQDIELNYVPLGGPEGEVEVLIESLEAPASIRQGQGFDLRVIVNSSANTSASLRVFGDGELLRTLEVRLSPGLNRFLVPVEAAESGFRRFRAQIVPDVDTRLQNNEASSFTVVYGPPAILVVEGEPGEAQNLGRALEAAGMTATIISPAQLPATLPELANYDAVFLANVPAEALPAGGMDNLKSYVRDLGRGLVMSGGQSSFGAGGYLRTPLEEALPVDMDVRNTEQTPNMALVLAVDKSGSMGRCHCDDPDLNQTYDRREVGQPKVDIAKAAILQASSALGNQDYLGVVAFDSLPGWAYEVQKQVDVLALEESIGGIVASGQTNVQAGVEAAYDSLIETEARVKHVILLTDGWTRGGDLVGLAREMQENGITLSVVAAGGGSAEYLIDLATAGGGRYYPAEDILQVPDFFLKETVKAIGRYIIEEPFFPVLGDIGHPVLRGLATQSLPVLLGYNGTSPKGTARISLFTPAGDPLLATWQYGLGKAAVWTSDLKSQWAIDWLAWEEFPKFVAQMVGWTLPTPQVEGLRSEASFQEGNAVLEVQATGQDGLPRNFLEIRATLIGPDLAVRQLNLEQVGPGRYRAETSLDRIGSYLAQLQVEHDGQPVGQQVVGLVAPYSPEYKSSGIDLGFLNELTGRTGGGLLPAPAEAFLHNLPSAERAREIWEPLLLIAALLFPLDVAIRRVMFSSRDVRQAVDWMRARLPLNTSREAATNREPLLGQLFSARERARQRSARFQDQEHASQPDLKSTPLSDAAHSTLERSEAQPAQPDEGEVKMPPEPTEELDTLARLRSAKKRTRKNNP